jgi:hypothetical protein
MRCPRGPERRPEGGGEHRVWMEVEVTCEGCCVPAQSDRTSLGLLGFKIGLMESPWLISEGYDCGECWGAIEQKCKVSGSMFCGEATCGRYIGVRDERASGGMGAERRTVIGVQSDAGGTSRRYDT